MNNYSVKTKINNFLFSKSLQNYYWGIGFIFGLRFLYYFLRKVKRSIIGNFTSWNTRFDYFQINEKSTVLLIYPSNIPFSHIDDLIKQFLGRGFKILIFDELESAEYIQFKEKLTFIYYKHINRILEIPMNNLTTHESLDKELNSYCIQILINFPINSSKNPTNCLEKQVVINSFCIGKMLKRKGKSLIVGYYLKQHTKHYSPEFYKFYKTFHNSLNIEYKNKIDAVFIKGRTNTNFINLNEIIYTKKNFISYLS
jgi:hypothetical protein